MVKPSDFKAVHRLIHLHYTRVVNPVTVTRSKLFASSSPAASPFNGFTQFQPKSSFHTFSSLPTTKNLGFPQICGLALANKPRVVKNVNFASAALRLFSTSGFRRFGGSLARKVVEKPMKAVSSSFGRYRGALGLQVDAFWKKNSLVVFGAGGVLVCIFLWRVMFGIASTFVGLSEGMAKYGFLALSSAIVAFAGLYLRARFTINPDKVYRIAMRKLNTSANILEVMGAPLKGSDLRAYVMSGGGIALTKFKPTIRSKRCFLLFPVQGAERKGLVSVEVKKKKGQYDMKLLAVDIPMASGPDQRVFLIGDEEEYRVGGGLISELRDPVVKAMAAAKEFDTLDMIEEEEDEERELLEAERKQREEDEERELEEAERKQREEDEERELQEAERKQREEDEERELEEAERKQREEDEERELQEAERKEREEDEERELEEAERKQREENEERELQEAERKQREEDEERELEEAERKQREENEERELQEAERKQREETEKVEKDSS